MLKVGFNRHFQVCLSVLALTLLSTIISKAQTFESVPVEVGEYGTLYIYEIETSSLSGPVEITSDTPLPSWLLLDDHNDGTATLSGTPTEVGNFPITLRVTSLSPILSSTQDVDLNIAKATPIITWANPAPITYGTALSATQLNAVANVPGAFVYTPAAGTVLNAGPGQVLSVDFTPTDTDNYNSVNGTTVTITVNKATPVITWANPAAITYGTALGATQLNATADVAGSFVYSPASGTVLNAGASQTLSADFTPADGTNYNSVNGTTVTITVNKATPVITWANPAAINYGTALGATQLNATADVVGSFVYSPASGTVLNAGASQTLSADFTPADGTNYNTVTNIQRQITVNKVTPVITWANPAAITYGTALGATQLNATADVAGSFVYSPASGTVLNAGASQTLSADFTPADGTNYNTVTNIQRQITVNKVTPVITWANPAAITYGTALGATQLNATADVAGSFIYSPASGTVLNAGASQTLSADFTPADGTNYNTVTNIQRQITVNKVTPVITWANPAAITYGTALGATQLNATADVAGSFVYSPASGTVLNAGAGQILSVDFTPADGTNYNTVSGTTVAITVNKATPVITWANPAAITYGTALGATQLNATADAAGSFSYTPAAGAVLNTGTRTLSVNFTPTDAANYNAVNGTTATIEVNKATPVITWANPAAITYGTALGATQLNATADVAGSFAYTPAAGTVLNAGTRTLSANFTPTDAANYNAVIGTTVTIEVNKATPVITWANPAAITYGTALGATQLNATANVAGSFAYTPASGTVLNAGIGQILSTDFTPTDAANYNSVIGTTVLITVNKATPVITWTNPAAITYGTALGATQLNATANVAGSFAYTPPAGTILNAGANQMLSADFTPADGTNYNPVTGIQRLITVNKATPVITWGNPAAITYGTALGATQLNATADVSGSFVYTPAAGAVLNAGTRTLSADFTPTDIGNYNVVNGTSVTIIVNKATPIITWANPAPITYGTALSATQLNATADVAGSFVYTPASGAVLNAGTRTLSVNFTPTDAANYNIVNGTTVTINVNKATPVITWGNPAAITYGTALGATQLNATASVAGSFAYTPGAGTVLNAGADQTLSTDFTPTDAANYNAVTGTTVLITVNKATPVITWANPAAITYGTALGAAQLNATSNVAGSFAYTPIAGTVLNAGVSQTLSADFTPADGANYNPVSNIQRLITVNKATPVITWANPAAITYGTALGATQLNATADVAGSFVYSPVAGTVLNAGTRTLSVNFTPTDASNYNVVNGTTVSIIVNKATPVITWANPASIVYGTALGATQLNATADVPGTFAYTPITGTVLNAGTRTLSVNFTPTDAVNYNAVTGTTVSINVLKATPVITWANPAAITYGTPLGATQLNATANVAGAFVYTPAAGTVLSSGAGQSLSADFTPTDAANYNSVTGTAEITVNKATPVITWANPAAITYGTPLGATQLNATSNVAGSFLYTPLAGTVLNAGPRTLSVNFTPADAGNYNAVNGTTVTINVNKATPVITWASPSPIIYGTALSVTQLNATADVAGSFVYTPVAGTVLNVGSNQTLSANFTPTDAANYNVVNNVQRQITVNKATPVVTWANPAAITYGTALGATQQNATANVPGSFSYTPVAGTILSAGASQVLSVNFIPSDAANYNSVNGTTVTITVNKATPNITWANPAAITYGTVLGSTQLNATANVPGSFDYSPAGGTVLNAGLRTLSVNFTPSDASNYNSVNGTTVTITVNKATPVVIWPNPAAITYGTTLSATQLNATADVSGSFAYTPAAGILLNAGAGQTLSCNFTPADAANYNPVNNVQRLITVNKATPVVTWANPAPIIFGTPLSATQQNSTFSVPGTATYIPGPGTILPTGASQAITVNWVPTDQANYNSLNGTQVLITVSKATPVITWANPADITYGTALGATQLNPTASVPGSFVFNPASGTVLSAGAGQTLTATFTPTDQANYNVVAGITRTINVNKANPVITWAAPSPITYGTALSGTQLNASGSVAGSSGYSPPAGTVLNAGANQTLTSTFTPTDQVNYNVIITNRTITVNKATPVITWPTPAAITYGTPLTDGVQLAVTANVPGTTVYNPPTGTILNAGAGQTLLATFTPGDPANYNTVTNISRSITVNKATPVVTWATPLPIKVGVALSGTQLNAAANVPGDLIYTPAAGTSFGSEGVQTLHVRFEPDDETNYNVVPDTQVQLTVSSRDNPVITWNDPAAITYGTILSSAQNSASANVPGGYSYSPNNGVRLNAGIQQALTVTFTPTDQVNYNIVTRTVHIDVSKATLTATAQNANRNYGAANPSFGITYSGFVGTETAAVIDTPPTATCSAIGSDPAGSTFPIVPAGGVDNNYQFTYVNGTLTINKAPLTAKADNKSREYGLSDPDFTISYTGFVNGDDENDITQPSASTTALLGSNVGNYPITLTGGAASNYNITLQPGTLTVNKALLVVIGNNLTKAYGQLNPLLTFGYLGFRNGDTQAAVATPPTATTPATTASGVGTYAINLAGGSATNYSLTLFPGSLTITKAPLIAKADDKTRVYGTSNPGNSISYNGFMNTDGPGSITQPSISGPAATPASDAGTYPIQLTGGSAANYDLTLQNGTLTVTKAVLNAKADNKSRLYGQTNPTFTLSYTGFVNGDNATEITEPTASTIATAASPVATYLITPAGGSATNYSFTYQNGTLTVDPASLVARANDRTRMYGQANPLLTISYTGFLNGDDAGDITPPTSSTTATTASNTGTYPITLSGGSAQNYTLTRQSGTMTVTKATLTAKADDKTKVYGTANPSNSISYTGFVNGDDAGDITAPSISGPGTTASSPVGVYPITLSGGSATNYTFVHQNGALTITKATLTAKADNKSRLYGASNPPFTITYTGFVGGDNASSITVPVASTAAVPTSDVATYPITLSGTTPNYTFVFQNGTLTVNKATVTVTADNQTKTYGADIPALSMTYSGLVNSETTVVIDTPPTPSTTAVAGSAVGNYPITLAGGSDNNYLFTYAPGTLTVSKAPLTAKADNKLRFYGDPNPPNSITYTGFVNGDTQASITPPVAVTTANLTSPLGDYPIVLTGGSATNYTITLQPGVLSVIPAQLTVTALNQSRAYGAANPVLSLSYAGFATGHSIADIDVLPVAATTATTSSNTGSYPITVSGGVDDNYSFLYASGTLTVTKALLTVTAESKSATYGDVPPLTLTYSGFVNGETEAVIDTPPTISTTATSTSAPGVYPISLTAGSDNNYTIANVEGTMTIGKATLIAKADDKSRITGVANPALTVTYTGFKNNETTGVIDVLPTTSTVATIASAAGDYPIDVGGGSDDNYAFFYQAGTLTVVLDNPPVLKNFQVEASEDVRFDFTHALFAANYTDEPNGKIAFIKVMTLPQNGVLFRGTTPVNAADEIQVSNGQLEEFYYVSNSNFNGSDGFTWNLFDGNYLAVTPATITIKIKPVNDAPVLSNIESNPLAYSPGDDPVKITSQIIVNDVDDNFIYSASVKIAGNYTQGDALGIDGGTNGTKIEATYSATTGELKLEGKEGRATYENFLTKVTYSSPVTGEATISEKTITIIVRDSIADSNIASRIVDITEVFPELDLVNSFTPNGDGVNDEWDILNLQLYSSIEINVYDYNSTRVFNCRSKDCKWDGTMNGKALPAGPYSYTINLNNGKRKYQGTVTILK